MDRKQRPELALISLIDVALRKESVDRKRLILYCALILSVALRKESVDRNPAGDLAGRYLLVALRKESVDRNIMTRAARCTWRCRSPQGERG